MTRFNIDFYPSKETTISEAYIPESSEKATDCHFSNQLALSFEFTRGFVSKENFSLSNGNAGMFMHEIILKLLKDVCFHQS